MGEFTNVLRSITNASSLSTVPDDVSLLTDISELTMSRCNLTDFPSHAGFQRLEKLELAQNRLQSFSIANATKLTQLNLSHNALDKIPPTIFHLAALERLHLEGNPIRGFQPSQSELAFLMKIPFLSMDQEQFSSECKSPTRIKQFTVCPSHVGGDEPAKSLGDDTANNAITKKEMERSSSGWIIALDVLLAIGIVVAVVLIVRRDKRERRQRFNAERNNIYDTLAAQRSPRMTTLDVNELAAFRLEMDTLVKSRRIATGSASEVWLAIHAAKRVAVKQLIPDEATPETVQRFTHEGKLLSELSHRHIVAFVGVAWTDTTDLALVTIFAGKGDLSTYLKNAPRPADGDWDVAKLKMALGMAEALVYLHSLYQPVRHQNLQSRNVLLDDQFKTMVTGFDCAVRARSVASKAVNDGSLASRAGSVRWLAPEILSGSPYDASVDIFSLGVVLSELDTHAIPYAAVQDETGQPMGDEEIKSRVADGTLRLALSPTCPRLVRELALRCSSFKPSDRPRADEVVNALREIHHARLREQAATGTSVCTENT
jgi:Leucine-rich repeat (LRR) protein